MNASGRWGCLWGVTCVLVGVFLVFHQTFLSFLVMLPGDAGDSRYVNYMLEHGLQWISGNPTHRSFWDPPIFFPTVNTAAYSEHLLGAGPIYWIFRLAGFLPDASFLCWILLATVLNFTVVYLFLTRSAHLSSLAAAGGAYLFAFAGIRVNQLNSPQLLPQFFSLLAVMCLFEVFGHRNSSDPAVSGKKSPWIALFFACTVAQLYAGFYLGFFLCFGLLLSVAAALAFQDARNTLWETICENKTVIALSVIVSILALSWQAYHYLISQLLFGSRQWSEIGAMLPQLKSWINMGPSNWLYGWTTRHIDLSGLPDGPEQRLGVGLVTTAVALAGFRRLWGRSWGKILAVAFVAAFACSLLYPWGWSPWELVARFVPAAGAIRAVTRISVLLLIPLSVAVAFGLQGVNNRKLALAVFLLIILEQAQTIAVYDKNDVNYRVRTIAKAVPKDSRSFYYVISPDGRSKEEPWFLLQVDGMWAQSLVNVPTVNGFSGHVPPDWWPLWQPLIRTKLDLLGARLNAIKWADLNGLSWDTISVVPVIRDPLEGAEPDLANLKIEVGENRSRAFLGENWGEDECDHGRCWAWALNKRAVVYVPLLPGSDYVAQIQAGPMDAPSKLQSMTVVVNSTELYRTEMDAQMRNYRFELPARLVKDYNKMELLFSIAVSPASLGKAPDIRQLSAAVSRISFIRLDRNR